MNSTYQNHYKFGYNGLIGNKRISISDVWNFNLGKPKYITSLFEAAQDAAEKLWNQTKNVKKTLCMSGGLDSEFAAMIFLSKKLPFTVAIANWQNTNQFDIAHSIKFCEKNLISYKIYNINLVDFFKSSEFKKYIEIVQVDNPYIFPHMFLMDQIPDYPILGNGEPDIFDENGYCYVSFKEQPAAWHKFCDEYLHKGCGGFWEYTPELMVSYIHEIAKTIKTNEFNSTQFSKFKSEWMYKKFSLKKRKKYSGFERFHKNNYDFMKKILQNMPQFTKQKSFFLQDSKKIDINTLSNFYSKE